MPLPPNLLAVEPKFPDPQLRSLHLQFRNFHNLELAVAAPMTTLPWYIGFERQPIAVLVKPKRLAFQKDPPRAKHLLVLVLVCAGVQI